MQQNNYGRYVGLSRCDPPVVVHETLMRVIKR